jgi:hypothetical protein
VGALNVGRSDFLMPAQFPFLKEKEKTTQAVKATPHIN